MIIYNTTIKVHVAIQYEWLSWLKTEYIPAMLATRCFSSARILQLLQTGDTDGPTYAIQYHSENKALFEQYIERFSRAMQQKSVAAWGDQVISFDSLLKVVD